MRSCAVVLAALILASCASTRAADPLPPHRPKQVALGRGVLPSRVLVEPQDGVRALVRAIDAVQSRIFVETYILSDSLVVRALERAATQGVRVYVLLERHPLGLGTQPDREAQQLEAAGIAVRWTPGRFALTHAKFMVLDDRLAVVGTANFTRSAFTYNRELLIFDSIRWDVHDLSNLFRADWDRVRVPVSDPNLVVSPENSRPALYELIGAARHSIDVYAEEVADPGSERELVRAARRGVAVRVVLAWHATPSGAHRLLRGGVAVRELPSPYVHAKLVLVDRKVAFVGSENLSGQSLDGNREVGVLIRGRRLRRIETVFAGDWRRSAPVP